MLKQLYIRIYLKNARYAIFTLYKDMVRSEVTQRAHLAICWRLLVVVAASSEEAIKLEPIRYMLGQPM